MGPVVAIIAILAWAAITISKNRSKGGEDATRLVKALADQLDEATEEREWLRKRLENLEAIVTSKHWDQLEASAEADSLLEPSLDDEVETQADQAAKLARRVR